MLISEVNPAMESNTGPEIQCMKQRKAISIPLAIGTRGVDK
jgi:hypothetical protein